MGRTSPYQLYCEECQEYGYSSFKVPGILFQAIPGRLGFAIERCDGCQRFASDEAAEKFVKEAILEACKS